MGRIYNSGLFCLLNKENARVLAQEHPWKTESFHTEANKMKAGLLRPASHPKLVSYARPVKDKAKIMMGKGAGFFNRCEIISTNDRINSTLVKKIHNL